MNVEKGGFMGKVQRLPENLANLIAAGEVVERPASVVKELVENCIDANSTEIEIRLLEAGIKEIKIIDNGDGMSRSDAILSVERHATSKITSVADLFNIKTLGFRGEALPSIGSVSDFTLRTYNGEESTQIKINFGKDLKVSSAPHRKGTEITVRELFVRTPARLKYLKSSYIELAVTLDYVRKIALSNTNLKLSVFNDNKRVFYTSGTGELKNTLFNVYGSDVVNNLIDINYENADYKITGYICRAEINKSNSKMINFSVNNRTITNFKLNKALINAYGTLIPNKRYPVCFLNITLDTSLVDVNVHPAKLEVRFSKEHDVIDAVFEATRNALIKEQTVIKGKVKFPVSSTNEINNTIVKENNFVELEDVAISNLKSTNVNSNEKPLTNSKTISKFLDELSHIPKTSENTNVYRSNEDTYFSNIGSGESYIQEDIFGTNDKNELSYLKYIGQFHGSYVIAENSASLYIVDQHAAAERVNYEKILDTLNNKKYNNQELLVPIHLEYSAQEIVVIDEYIEGLKDFGVYLEKFSDTSYIIRSIPIIFIDGKEKENIIILIDTLLKNKGKNLDGLYERMAANISCKASIKANNHVSENEISKLFSSLAECRQPFTCPHGRPTIIKFTHQEIDKMFKRS